MNLLRVFICLACVCTVPASAFALQSLTTPTPAPVVDSGLPSIPHTPQTLPPAPEELVPHSLVVPDTVGQTQLPGHPGVASVPPIPQQFVAQPNFVPVGVGLCYWRVSTRNCGQTFDEGIANCRPAVEFCWPNGQWRRSSQNELLANLQPGVPIVIMIHGSLVDEKTNRYESVATNRWLRNAAPGRPLNVIFFDWPSERRVGPLTIALDYGILGSQSARNGFPLARLICSLPQQSAVVLMGHSHGGRAAVAAVHLLSGGTVRGVGLGKIDRVHRIRTVLLAGAIDHDWLNPGQRYDRALGRSECLINVRNKLDFALLAYPLRKPFGVHAFGQKGLTPRDKRTIAPENLRKVSQLDVDEILGSAHMWPNYFKQPSIARSLVPVTYSP